MYKLLTSKGQLFAILLGVLSVAIALGTIISGVKSNYSMSENLNDVLKNNADANFDFFNPAINIVVVLVVLACLAMLLFGVVHLLSDPKGSIKAIIGLALVVGLFFILYSSAEVGGTAKLAELIDKNDLSDNVAKLISGGVKTAVIAAMIAFFAAVVMEVINLFK